MATRKRDPLGDRKTTMVEVVAALADLARTDIGGGLVIADRYRPFIMMCLDSPGLTAKQIAWDIGLIARAHTRSKCLGN